MSFFYYYYFAVYIVYFMLIYFMLFKLFYSFQWSSFSRNCAHDIKTFFSFPMFFLLSQKQCTHELMLFQVYFSTTDYIISNYMKHSWCPSFLVFSLWVLSTYGLLIHPSVSCFCHQDVLPPPPEVWNEHGKISISLKNRKTVDRRYKAEAIAHMAI